MPKRWRVVVAVAVAVVTLAVVVFGFARRGERPRYVTAVVERGRIEDVVGATGVLRAVTTVQVGSQVSGTIQSLYADFNGRVTRGQIVARLDPSLFEARLEQARANLVAAEAQVERAQASIDDTRQKYERARELFDAHLLPRSELDTAQAAYDGARAQHRANQAAVTQAEASLNQARVDLGHTVIRAPIDGVVLARNVDVGQTVAASFQAPVLFVIAGDLTRMQVSAAVDEADVGRVQAGQVVGFRVDAFPDETFAGRIEQVRLQPTTTQNVVTYDTIIAVDNPRLRLMPGMTATVSAVVQEREAALRLPVAALRFRPEGFSERESGRGGERGTRPAAARAPQGRSGARRAAGASGASAEGGRPGLVFTLDEAGRPRPARVRLGLSDGRFVELLEGLGEGARVVTGLEGAERASARPAPSASSNPFAPQRFQPRAR